MSEFTIPVTDSSFATDVLQSQLPVLVDFWAAWCGPCRMLSPIIEELAQQYSNKIKVAKLNIDDNNVTANAYGIRSIPTLILFKNGKPIATKIGLLDKAQLALFIEENC